MIVYSYNSQNGQYVGETTALPGPLDPHEILYPAFTTPIAPPAEAPGNIRVFKDGAWGYVRTVSPSNPPTETPQLPTLNEYTAAISLLLDQTAQQRLYDNALTISTYVTSSVPGWKEDAEKFVTWRDQIWSYALAQLSDVQAGNIPQPTLEDFMSDLQEAVPFSWS